MITDLDLILADLQANWILYLAMPFVAAAIGYGTKVVAIKMMFKPLKFVGIRPYFGWQGIVPSKSATMASIACDLMMERLLKPEDVFDRLDPNRVAEEIREPLIRSVEDITREVAAKYQPGLWESAPERVKKMIIQRIQNEAPHMVELIMEDIKTNITRVFDLKDLVINALVRDKELLNRVFLEAGHVLPDRGKGAGLDHGLARGGALEPVAALVHARERDEVVGGCLRRLGVILHPALGHAAQHAEVGGIERHVGLARLHGGGCGVLLGRQRQRGGEAEGGRESERGEAHGFSPVETRSGYLSLRAFHCAIAHKPL